MRKDGRRIRHGNAMYTVVPYIMAERSDSQNMIELFLPVDPMNEYIRKKHEEGQSISHLALVIGAYVRALAEYPALNRFIVNSRIYARKGIQVGMVVLKPGGGSTMNKMYFDPADDIFEVNRKITEYVEKSRQEADSNATDKMIDKLLAFPGVCRMGIGLFKWMDKHGLLPESVLKASPFHVSMIITNLASIRTNHIYHHIYNFGTTSQLIAMGNLREVPVRDAKSGGIRFERCLPLGVVMDERIADGHYYGAAFKRIQAYLKDPTLMEGPPKVCVREWEDKDI